MSKKGQEGLSMGTIASIVIVLAVVIIVIMLVRNFATKGAQQYGAISKEATLNATKCTSIILGRNCAREQDCPPEKRVSGTWQDCKPPKIKCCSTI